MKKFSEVKKGDYIYSINPNDGYKVCKLKVEEIKNYWRGPLVFKTDYWICNVKRNLTRDGLTFTMEEPAVDFVENVIKKKKLFYNLKPGDVIYGANGKYEDIIKLTVISNNLCSVNDDSVQAYDKNVLYCNAGKTLGIHLTISQKYCESAAEDFWRLRDICPKHWNGDNITMLFINEKDALLYVQKKKREREKKAIEKYVKESSNHGKPITIRDNKGNELHYGDRVAYVRRNGLNSHTDISFGVVTGESKTKIKILDEEELKNGKPNANWWNHEAGPLLKSDGLHALEPQNVIFISAAVIAEKSFGK